MRYGLKGSDTDEFAACYESEGPATEEFETERRNRFKYTTIFAITQNGKVGVLTNLHQGTGSITPSQYDMQKVGKPAASPQTGAEESREPAAPSRLNLQGVWGRGAKYVDNDDYIEG